MACASDADQADGGQIGSETVTSKEASVFDGEENVKLQIHQNEGAEGSASDGSILDELECQEIQTASFQAPNLAMENRQHEEAGLEVNKRQVEKTFSVDCLPAKPSKEIQNTQINTLRPQPYLQADSTRD